MVGVGGVGAGIAFVCGVVDRVSEGVVIALVLVRLWIGFGVFGD